MANGLNTTGLPNTNSYSLGRGRLSAAAIDATTGLPLQYRDLGNAPEFNITITTEKLEHSSSRQGLKTIDKEVIISQKMECAFSLDEWNFQNLALNLSGAAATQDSSENIGMAANSGGITFFNLTASMSLTDVYGKHYDIINISTKKRLYNIDAGVVLGTDLKLFVNATEFSAPQYAKVTLDRKNGRIFVASDFSLGSSDFDPTVPLIAKWASAISTTVFDEVKAATQTNIKMAIKFIKVNPANGDEESEYQFHQVSLKPNGDTNLIGEEFGKFAFTGVVEANALADADSPYLTIRE